MAGKTQVKNQEYIEAYNAYLADHNLQQTRAVYIDASGLDYPIDVDMFFSYLVDQVAMQIISDVNFRDPLGDLYRGDIREGRIIQDIIPISGYKFENYDVHEFEKDVTNPYKKKKDKLSVYYMTTDAYMKVKTTYSRKQIISAFQSVYGIDALVNSLITLLYTKKNAWRYNAKKEAISNPNFVTRKTISSYQDFTLNIKDLIDELQYSYDNSYKYNRAVVPNPVTFNDIVIVMKAKYKNRVDIEYLAGLYNVSFAELKGKIKYIDEFPGYPNRVAVACDIRGLYFFEVLNMDTELFNPADISTNRWVHFWEMIEACPNYNAVAFDDLKEEEANSMFAKVSFESNEQEGQKITSIIAETTDDFNEAVPTLQAGGYYLLKAIPPQDGFTYSLDDGDLAEMGQIGTTTEIGLSEEGLHTIKIFNPQNVQATYCIRIVKPYSESLS